LLPQTDPADVMIVGVPNVLMLTPDPVIGTPAPSVHPAPVGAAVTVSVVPAIDAVKDEQPVLSQDGPPVADPVHEIEVFVPPLDPNRNLPPPVHVKT